MIFNNFFFKECMKGRSLIRSFQNQDIKNNVKIFGNCLDLGSKNSNPSYYEYINFNNNNNNFNMTYSDFYSKDKNVLSFDFNKKFPMKDNTFDNVLIFNVLEHVYNTSNVLEETRRVLKKNGKVYGVIPFLFLYHKDPSDYWRFTHEALEKLLEESGFINIKIQKHGLGTFTVINSIYSQMLRWRILMYISWTFGFFLDLIIKSIRKNRKENLYLGLYFECEK